MNNRDRISKNCEAEPNGVALADVCNGLRIYLEKLTHFLPITLAIARSLPFFLLPSL